jgi:hypothetical protein
MTEFASRPYFSSPLCGLDSDDPPAVVAPGKSGIQGNTLYLGVRRTPRPDRVDGRTIGMEHGHARVGDDGVSVIGFAKQLLVHFEWVEHALRFRLMTGFRL